MCDLVDEVEEMDMSQCSLTDAANVSMLTKLQWLNLSGNKLAQVPSSFKALTMLRHLDLTRNNALLVPPNAPLDRDGDMHYSGLLRAQAFVATLGSCKAAAPSTGGRSLSDALTSRC